MGVLVAIVLLLAGGFLGLITATGSSGSLSSTERLLSAFRVRTRNCLATLATMKTCYGLDEDTLFRSANIWAYFNSTLSTSDAIRSFDKKYQVPKLKIEFGNLYDILILANTNPGHISKVAKFFSDWYLGKEGVERSGGQDVDRFIEAILGLSTAFSLLNRSQEYKKLRERLPHYRPNAGPSHSHIKRIYLGAILDEPIMEIDHAITAKRALDFSQLQQVEANIRKAAVWIILCYSENDYGPCIGKLGIVYDKLKMFEGVRPSLFSLFRKGNPHGNPFRH